MTLPRNIKTVVDGIRFDSKKELLRASRKAGLVTFEMQVAYQLSPGIKYKAGELSTVSEFLPWSGY